MKIGRNGTIEMPPLQGRFRFGQNFIFVPEPEAAQHFVPEAYKSQRADGSCALLLEVSEPEPPNDSYRRPGKTEE